MHKIQRLKAPEGWPVLGQYAAVILGDETLKTIQKDTEIQKAVADLLRWREQRKPEVAALVERLGSTPKTGAQLARKGFGQDALEAALGMDVAE